MGRYPFEEYSRKFMEDVKVIYSEAYWLRCNRRYKRIARDLKTHLEGKHISTTSPSRMSVDDITYHLKYRKCLNLSKSEYSHEVSALNALFDYCENSSLRACLRKYPLLKPNSVHELKPSMKNDSYKRIIEYIPLEYGNYIRVRAYAMVSVFLGCGLRTKELRCAYAADLHTKSWILDVIHVKGEDSYGYQRSVPVPPEFRDAITAYLKMRRDNNSTDSPALFPPSRGKNQYMSDNNIRKICSLVTEETGVEFNPRICRRTFGQELLDSDISSIEHVSVLIVHATIRTTEHSMRDA